MKTVVYALIATAGDRPDMLADALHGWYQVEGVTAKALVGGPAGTVYNELVRELPDDAVFFTTCDDTVPLFESIAPVLEVWESGKVPACRYVDKAGGPVNTNVDSVPAGTPLGWTRQPFLSKRLWLELGPFLDITWYLDCDYSDRLLEAGYPIVSCPKFVQRHLEGSRSWQAGGVAEREHEVYLAARRTRQLSLLS